MTTTKKKTRYFFPVKTEEDALEAIKIAYQATFALAAIQAVLLATLMIYTGRWNGDIVDPLFMVGLAWALRTRKSRTAAVVLTMYSLLIGFVTLAARVGLPMTEIGGRNVILAVLFIYASYKGVQGTFAYHRLTGASVRVGNVFLLGAVTFLYVVLYTFVCLAIFLVPDLAPITSTLSDNTLGLIWLVPSVAIIFAGSFRRLPGTIRLSVTNSESHNAQPKLTSHYLARHWRGELTLATSYWVNTIMVGIVFSIFFAILQHSGIFQSNLLVGIQIAVLLIVVNIPVYIWQFGGCWRSANQHVKETGRHFWARAAQVVLVLGAIPAGAQWLNAAPAFVEFVKIATRTERFTDYTVTVLENGDEIELTDYIGFGLDKELKQALSSNPNVKVIHLNSPGGRLEPARKVQDLIKERGLNTYTSTECSSACLIPFMAGRYRILKVGAKLGFHSYSFPGFTPSQVISEIEADKRYFATVGVDTKFLDKAFRVGSEELWFPEVEELIESKVITHTFDGTDFVSYVEQ